MKSAWLLAVAVGMISGFALSAYGAPSQEPAASAQGAAAVKPPETSPTQKVVCLRCRSMSGGRQMCTSGGEAVTCTVDAYGNCSLWGECIIV